jgi:hypothetical protein
MEPNFYAVLVDNNPSNPANFVAFFRDETAATAWRDANSQGASVVPVNIGTCFLQVTL